MLSRNLSDYKVSWLIAGYYGDLNKIRILPKGLSFVEIDPMFYLIASAFFDVEFIIHDIIIIPYLYLLSTNWLSLIHSTVLMLPQ